MNQLPEEDEEEDLSFDISVPDPEEVVPIVERTMTDSLSETVIQEEELTYTILESCSQKRSRMLVTNRGYAYGIKRENQTSTVWRCTSRSKSVKCPVEVKQVGDSFHQKFDHVHAPICDRELKLKVYSKVRQTACEQIFRPATAVAEDVLLQNHRPNNVAMLKKSLLKRTANRARAALRPTEPKSLDFQIDSMFIDGDNFLLGDICEDGQRHFLFSTEKQLQMLKEAKRWYMDGTFKIIGDPFQRSGQLMSIHAFVKKGEQMKQVPLLFCLMTRRTKDDYVKVLRHVRNHLNECAVEGFVLDFEAAAWGAIREVFPNVEVKGCAFHWAQAVWRQVQQVGLAESYRSRLGMYKFVRKILSLQFLPANHIKATFDKLAERATTPETTALANYVRRQWIETSTFPPENWSVYRQQIRTNNDVEGWHHRVNGKSAGCLGFYRLVPLLRREAELVQIQVEDGDLQRSQLRRHSKLDRELQTCWDEYSAGSLKVSSFLDRVGELYKIRM